MPQLVAEIVPQGNTITPTTKVTRTAAFACAHAYTWVDDPPTPGGHRILVIITHWLLHGCVELDKETMTNRFLLSSHQAAAVVYIDNYNILVITAYLSLQPICQ